MDIWDGVAARRAFRELRKIYQARGAAVRCHLIVGSGDHRFYAADAWPMMSREIERL